MLTPTEDEKRFEHQVCKLANYKFGDGCAEIFGRRGQNQYGIDIIVRQPNGQRVAIQCKQTVKDKVPARKLEDDFERAISSGIKFDHFIFATTAPRDSALQRLAIELETKRNSDPKISIWSWSEITEWASRDQQIREIFDPNFSRNRITIDDYRQPSLQTQEFVRRKLGELLDRTLQSNYLTQRFIPELYVQREIEKELSKWIDGETKKFKCNTTYLVAPAGSGKTCLAASLANTFRTTHNVVLLPAAFLRRPTELTLFEYAEHNTLKDLALEKVRGAVQQVELLAATGPTLVIVDGINEAHSADWMKRELLGLSELHNTPNLHVLVTCRDYYWGAFEDRTFTETGNIVGEYRQGGSQRKQLADFRFSEYQSAVSSYSQYYDVDFTAQGTAKEQFRHPLLLRFFCETYIGEKIGVVRNIRLKELFDTYTERKSDQLTRELQKHVGVGLHARQEILRQDAMNFLEKIAMAMLNRNSRVVSATEFLDGKSASEEQTGEMLFHRIIDEYIILEELGQEANDAPEVSFVFEAYMEYCMASALHRSMLSSTIGEITESIRILTSKYSSFVQIIGVVLFLSLFLKERRKIAIWPALFEMGEIWQKVILEAFRKLPTDQIDDGVFDAVTDLLKSNSVPIQVETLELLKHGRLRRPISNSVINAIKPLLQHKDPKVFRRAIHVVGELPKDQALRLFEYLIERRGKRITDWYLIRDYTLKYISRIHSRRAFMLEMTIYGAEEFPNFARSSLSAREIKWWTEAIYADYRPVRIGALQYAAQATDQSLVAHLREFIAKPDIYPLDRREMSVARSSIEFHFSVHKLKDESFEMSVAKHALSKLIRQLQNDRNCARILKFVRGSSTLPDLIKMKKLCRGLRFPGYFDVEVELIARGLEVRSGRKWSVGFVSSGRYGQSAIRISAPRRALRSRNKMALSDWRELTKLLDSNRFDHEKPEATYTIPVYTRNRDYEGEYCYRAWGEEPKVRGYLETYYD
ncbi:NACHT domain-containing protein [Shimia sp. MMG029]|uniref:NACHT domain-containing protein n=1 Tax=Shimia sp. MMG029 TaxID=3021978 RepID=UPI003F8F83AE